MHRPLPTLFVAALAACAAGEPVEAPAKSPPVDPLVLARDDARVVLERHCGRCHLPNEPTAIGGALAIFDLSEEEWAARLETETLAGIYERLRPADGMTMDPEAAPTTPEERSVVRDYLLRRFGPHPAPAWIEPQ